VLNGCDPVVNTQGRSSKPCCRRLSRKAVFFISLFIFLVAVAVTIILLIFVYGRHKVMSGIQTANISASSMQINRTNNWSGFLLTIDGTVNDIPPYDITIHPMELVVRFGEQDQQLGTMTWPTMNLHGGANPFSIVSSFVISDTHLFGRFVSALIHARATNGSISLHAVATTTVTVHLGFIGIDYRDITFDKLLTVRTGDIHLNLL